MGIDLVILRVLLKHLVSKRLSHRVKVKVGELIPQYFAKVTQLGVELKLELVTAMVNVAQRIYMDVEQKVWLLYVLLLVSFCHVSSLH